ncbi:MAG: fimbrillin family protein [Prevotella sp.]|nr:fimbrillin family protein [Prevotella sp.]
MKKRILYIGVALSIMIFAACSSDNDVSTEAPKSAKETPMTFDVIHPSQTKATATEFENGDKIGVYIAKTDMPLEIGGNTLNNEQLTLTSGTWTPSKNLFWDEGTYNAYAYYPYMDVTSIEDQPVSVATDQSSPETDGKLSGYEASDLLYAKTSNVAASTSPVTLNFKHIMSKLTIRLVKGEDFEGDMPTDAEIFIHNTVPTATFDISAGIVTRDVKGKKTTIKARQESDFQFGAIIVPQRLDNRVPLVEVIMKGVSYLFESKFLFKPGVDHLVNLVITDNPEQVKIEVGGEVENWQ